MQVGQFIYLKSSILYVETYDVPTIQGSVIGYNAGYVGKVTKLNVAGVGETQTFTEISDKYLAKRYFSNKDVDKFDFTDVGPDGKTSNSDSGSSGNSGSGSSTTLDKISNIFAGILGIFGKKTTTTTPTAMADPKTADPTVKDPNTNNNNDNTSGIAAWVKKNVVLVIIGALLIVGGIIWAIVAAVKADKKDKAFMMNRNQTQPLLNPVANP